MTKEAQKQINQDVLNVVESIKSEGFMIPLSRLITCQADVYESHHYFILKSYHTFVACINKNTGCGFDFLRYSYGYTATSAQHISKFFKDYGAKTKFVYR